MSPLLLPLLWPLRLLPLLQCTVAGPVPPLLLSRRCCRSGYALAASSLLPCSFHTFCTTRLPVPPCAAASSLPDVLVNKLKPGGRMVIPVGRQWEFQVSLLASGAGAVQQRQHVMPGLRQLEASGC